MNSPSERQARLADQHRRWAAWAATAITDTPPEIFAGQPLDPGSEAAMHCGGAQVAPDNLWWLDGLLVTEHEWSIAEHADDPPEWATWPPARRAGRSDAPVVTSTAPTSKAPEVGRDASTKPARRETT